MSVEFLFRTFELMRQAFAAKQLTSPWRAVALVVEARTNLSPLFRTTVAVQARGERILCLFAAGRLLTGVIDWPQGARSRIEAEPPLVGKTSDEKEEKRGSTG